MKDYAPSLTDNLGIKTLELRIFKGFSLKEAGIK